MSTPSNWSWERRIARALDRAHLLKPAASLYETALGVRDALTTSRRREAGGVPVPPAYLRVKVGPVYGDLAEFLGSGARHAELTRGLLSEFESDPLAAAPILDFGCGLAAWRERGRGWTSTCTDATSTPG